MELTLPELPYDYAALEPHIDAETMKLHHDKHHATYLEKLLAALDKHPELKEKPIEELLGNLDAVPEDIRMAVRNHGGGFVNHAWFWESMAPNAGGEPSGALAEAMNKSFGSFQKFTEEFTAAALGQFGSGWAWLAVKEDGSEPHIHAIPNQDNPLMHGHKPILGLDVWEHAYYLKYQNKRADYIKSWWNVINWKKVEELFGKAGK